MRRLPVGSPRRRATRVGKRSGEASSSLRRRLPAAVGAACVALAGCGGGPSRIDAPAWDPPRLASEILAQLDQNGDARLDAEELAGAPGLASAAPRIDADRDGRLSAGELATQFEKYRDLRVGLRTPAFRLTYKGRPVPDAEVRFVPEPFLAGLIEPASATTDVDGLFYPQSEGQDVPGVRLGYYRVLVTSPKLKIPAKYAGAESPLGAHVSLAEDAASYGVNSLVQLKITD